jgi:hypothetical protein
LGITIPNDETVAEVARSLLKKELIHEGALISSNKAKRINPGIKISRSNIFIFLDTFIKLIYDFIGESE